MSAYYVIKEPGRDVRVEELKLTCNTKTDDKECVKYYNEVLKPLVDNSGVRKHRIFDDIYMLCADDFNRIGDKHNFYMTIGISGVFVKGAVAFTRCKHTIDFGMISIGLEKEEADAIVESFRVHEEDGEILFEPHMIQWNL